MKNMNETGHAVNVDHFLQLKTITLGFGATYAPGNPRIQQEALETLYTNGKTANDAVAAPLALWKDKVSARQLVMAPLSKLTTRVARALKASGAAEETIVQVGSVIRKIQGSRSRTTETTKEGAEVRSISSSQLSITQRISNFRALLELLATIPSYVPSAADIKIQALQTLLTDMEAANGAVISAEVLLTAARQHRDTVLYAPATGLTDVAQAVKDEVAAIFGFGSPAHKELTRIRFTNPR